MTLTYVTQACTQFTIGRVGEGNVHKFLFQIPAEYRGSSVELSLKLPNGSEQTTPLFVEEGRAVWIVPFSATEEMGAGTAKLIYTNGETVEEGITWRICIDCALELPEDAATTTI